MPPLSLIPPGRAGRASPLAHLRRLDCPSELRAIARGGYVTHRVFFADEATAVAAGYRPCARCLPTAYRAWKDDTLARQREERESRPPRKKTV
ncbi:Ada metal-binding domain-containing protein [Nostocoides australiense]